MGRLVVFSRMNIIFRLRHFAEESTFETALEQRMFPNEMGAITTDSSSNASGRSRWPST